jgi:hypothetical protein
MLSMPKHLLNRIVQYLILANLFKKYPINQLLKQLKSNKNKFDKKIKGKYRVFF